MPILFDTQLARRAGENHPAVIGVPWFEVIHLTTAETSGTISVPVNTFVKDILVHAVALRNTGTSSVLVVGDDDDDDGYYTAVNLKATDLLAGQSISFALTGGKEGAYLVTPDADGYVTNHFYPEGGTITATITDTGTAPTEGEHYIVVELLTLAGS